jgi:hypothetical protein
LAGSVAASIARPPAFRRATMLNVIAVIAVGVLVVFSRAGFGAEPRSMFAGTADAISIVHAAAAPE